MVEPQVIGFWVIIGVFTGVPLFFLLMEALEQRIAPVEFGFGVAAFLAVLAGIRAAWGTSAGVVLIIGFVLLAIFTVVSCRRVMSLSDRPVLERELARTQLVVARNPENPAARLYLGELYLKLDRHEEGLRELEEAVRLHPSPASESRLERAREEWQAWQSDQRLCPICRTANPRSALTCSNCGSGLLFRGFVAEELGLVYRGKPRWGLVVFFVPLLPASLALGLGSMYLILVMIGVTAIPFAWRLAKLSAGGTGR